MWHETHLNQWNSSIFDRLPQSPMLWLRSIGVPLLASLKNHQQRGTTKKKYIPNGHYRNCEGQARDTDLAEESPANATCELPKALRGCPGLRAEPLLASVRKHFHNSQRSKETWKWVWLKIKQEGQTAGFGPCFHLPGQPISEFRFFEFATAKSTLSSSSYRARTAG